MKILKKYVVRIDSQKIENFSSNLKSYYRNSDWTTIGSYDDNKSPEGFKKVQGLFADDAHFNAIYAAGDPYDNQYVTFEDPKTKKSVVVFSKENETKIKNVFGTHNCTILYEPYKKVKGNRAIACNYGLQNTHHQFVAFLHLKIYLENHLIS
jgi:hypothetical protein